MCNINIIIQTKYIYLKEAIASFIFNNRKYMKYITYNLYEI